MGAGEASRHVLGFEGWWGLPALPKLNVENPQTRAYLLDVAEHWLRFGIDGWRLDVAEEVSGDFWSEFRQRCRAVRPDAYLVAEIWQPKPEWLTGHQFDALMNYPLAEATLGYAAGQHLDLRIAAQHNEYQQFLVPRDGASFGRGARASACPVRPGCDVRDAQPAGQPRRAARTHRVWR